MSLKGSLQTVALPEVLNFLSDTGKSGEFHVSGSHGDGRIWFEEGRISGFQAARAERPFEAIFELLRISDGEFDFAAGTERPTDACIAGDEDGNVASALEEAEARLAEWNDIVRVVPSLSHRVQLRAESPAQTVSLEPDQWLMVVAIGAGRTVGEVIDQRGLQEFDGCKAVRTLVDASLVDVLEPVEEPVVAEPVVEEPAFQEPVSFDPVPVEAAVEEPVFEEPTFKRPVAFEPVVEAGTEETAPGYGGFGFSSFSSFTAGTDPVEEPYRHGADEVDGAHFAEAPESGGDHYAVLRAAMVEVGDNLVGEGADLPQGDHEDVHPVYEFDEAPVVDSRAALQALLHEVAGPEDVDESHDEVRYDEAIDGLADRGPWTQHELATMDSGGGWSDEPAEDAVGDSNIVPFAPVHQASEGDVSAEAQMVEGESGDTNDTDDAEDEPPAEEPINRGLLLKFLSSVRN